MFLLTCSTGLSPVDWVWAVFALQPITRKTRRSTTKSRIVILKLHMALDMAKDFVHDADKRLCCIDYDATAGFSDDTCRAYHVLHFLDNFLSQG